MTILNQGDVAVVGWQPDTVDAFSVVLLVDVDTNHPIIFTDQSWTDGNNFATGEAQFSWTPSSNLTAGTIVTFSETGSDGVLNVYINGVSSGTVNATQVGTGGSFWSIASGGDQLFVLQGSLASPTLIWGTDFDDSSPEGAWSGIPAGTSGTNSTQPLNSDLNTDYSPAYIELGTGTGNGNLYYSGTTTGTKAELQAAIANAANWTAQSTAFTSTAGADPFTSLSAMTVQAPGAAPTVDTNTGSSLNEGAVDVITSSELDTNDIDTADTSLTYTITTSSVSNGTLWRDFNFNNVVDGGESALGLGGTFTQNEINSGTIRYQHNGGETTSDSFGFQVSDGPNSITGQTFTFSITPVNDLPVITGFHGDVSAYNELFGVPVPIESGTDVSVTDPDHANFNGDSLTVSITSALSEDQLSINNGGINGIGVAGGGVFYNSVQFGTVSGGANGANLVITFTSATATPAVIEELIEALRYDNSSADNPTGGARSINIVLNDGAGNSATSTATVNVTAVNDNPGISGLPTDVSVTEDTAGNIDLSAATLTDPDSDPITVTLSVDAGTFSTPADGAGVGAGVTETLVNATTITLVGSVADITTYLDTASNIQYTGALNANGDDAATLSISANDGDGSGDVALGTVNIDITAVDDPAVAVDDAVSVNETATLNGDVFATNPTTADSDAENDAFSVTEVNGNAANVGTQITLTSGALLTLNANGTFSYNTNGAFDGMALGATDTDTFTYTITGGDTATVTVTINGEDGDEVFDGTAETGNFNGGPLGHDTVSYINSASGVVADMNNPANNTGDAVGDTYTDIEQLDGSNFNDTLTGTSGDDILEGWDGNDRMIGLGGNDFYYVDNPLDEIVETAGNGTMDRVSVHMNGSYTLAAGVDIELMTTANSAGTTAMNLIGNEVAQTIVGNDGVNTLGDGGGAGADILHGRGGDDTYRVYNAGTQVFESSSQGANDRLGAGVNYVLADGVFIELLTTTSRNATYSRNIEGNTSKQTIVGNDGKNVLGDGGGSVTNGDTLIGGDGNDVYVVRSAGTTVVEAVGEGTFDRVSTSKSFTLSAGSEVESINTTSRFGTNAIDLTGNELAQWLQGNGGANRLDGKEGTDEMSGEGGNDTFVFSTALGAGNIDTIRDYSVADDQIELASAIFTGLSAGTLGANAFVANTSGTAQTADHRIIYDTDDGGLFYDADGNGAGAAQQFATLTTGLALTNSDFDLV